MTTTGTTGDLEGPAADPALPGLRPSGRRPGPAAHRVARLAAALVVVFGLLPAVGTGAAGAAAGTPIAMLAMPVAVDPVEAYAPPGSCGPARVGTLAFRKMILDTYGRQTVGTTRTCPASGKPTSDHEEGRAVDWMLSASNAAQRATAQAFLAWLLAPDAAGNPNAVARRLGVSYLIWNGKIWRAYRPTQGWQPYSGPNPHTDHIHISLSWRGADAETSWWTGQATPIEGHWVRLGGARSFLGQPSGRAAPFVTGTRRTFAGGSVFVSPRTPAREVHGPVLALFTARAGELGFPTTDLTPTIGRTGAVSRFEKAMVAWSPRTGARVVRGATLTKWSAMGAAGSVLGFPTRDQAGTPTKPGTYQTFENGIVYWSAATGAHPVYGRIRTAYAALGYERSSLGFPTADPVAVAGEVRGTFQHGSITVDSRTATVTVTRS